MITVKEFIQHYLKEDITYFAYRVTRNGRLYESNKTCLLNQVRDRIAYFATGKTVKHDNLMFDEEQIHLTGNGVVIIPEFRSVYA